MKIVFGIIGMLIVIVSFVALMLYSIVEALGAISVEAMREATNPWLVALFVGGVISLPYWLGSEEEDGDK